MTTLQKLSTIPVTDAGFFSQGDLAAFLANYEEHLNQISDERQGDALRSLLSLQECREVQTDREAELVRRGVRLGLCMAALDRKVYYSDVQRKHRRAGLQTKVEKLEHRNQQMAREYSEREPIVGCLNARRELRDKYKRKDGTKLTLQAITIALRSEGVNIGKRESK